MAITIPLDKVLVGPHEEGRWPTPGWTSPPSSASFWRKTTTPCPGRRPGARPDGDGDRGLSPRSRRSSSGPSRVPSPTCGSTPRSTRSPSSAGWCRSLWQWPWVSPRPVNTGPSGVRRARPRTTRSGSRLLRSLVKRGLRGVHLVTSDAHEGLRQAIEKVSPARCDRGLLGPLRATCFRWSTRPSPISRATVARQGELRWKASPGPTHSSLGGSHPQDVGGAADRRGEPLDRHGADSWNLVDRPLEGNANGSPSAPGPIRLG
jgi:hypothetical protein